ncbi:TetR/AcrR family transcriptional regulator [Demequina aestuarii]|uniref:TetR/AcrR family transcriptional regulator n=1 Tax=Demequina aestuarii TaxID=327095 RepID=UPI000784C37A|nr:TetR/AcrR family transcriptional regulator [Demequina aestuarii]
MARTVKDPTIRREEILAAARVLYARQGVRATTVQDLATYVGVTRGLIYHYVGDMDSLVTQVLDSYIDQFTADVREWDANRTPGDIDAAVMECIGLFRRYVPTRGDHRPPPAPPLPRIDDASLSLHFLDRAVDALVDVLEETTIPAYAARHPIEITHVRETFIALIHGLIALVRSQPTVEDDVLACLVRQTLRLAPSAPDPHPADQPTTALEGE